MRKILFASYPCSGLTAWLMNCMIELKILYTNVALSGDGHFKFVRKVDDLFDEYEKNPEDLNRGSAEQSCPSFLSKDRFLFRNDINFVSNAHRYFPGHNDLETIIGVRDPRDTMLSTFFLSYPKAKYEKDVETFYQFCQSQIQAWIDFYEDSFQYKNAKLFKFENRKKDELLFLKSVLDFMKIELSDKEIESAVSNSTYEKAKRNEDKIIADKKSSWWPGQMSNSGLVSQYLLDQNRHHQKSFEYIVRKAASLMKRLGYNEQQIYGDKFDNMLKIKKLFNN